MSYIWIDIFIIMKWLFMQNIFIDLKFAFSNINIATPAYFLLVEAFVSIYSVLFFFLLFVFSLSRLLFLCFLSFCFLLDSVFLLFHSIFFVDWLVITSCFVILVVDSAFIEYIFKLSQPLNNVIPLYLEHKFIYTLYFYFSFVDFVVLPDIYLYTWYKPQLTNKKLVALILLGKKTITCKLLLAYKSLYMLTLIINRWSFYEHIQIWFINLIFKFTHYIIFNISTVLHLNTIHKMFMKIAGTPESFGSDSWKIGLWLLKTWI